MKKNTVDKQYLRFKIDSEFYAIEIFKVREIIEPTTVTRIPKTPNYLLGVIDVRGEAVPVIDMRLKLGLEQIPQTIETAIIILELEQFDGFIQIGILVDSVQEVIELNEEELEEAPRFGTQLSLEYIVGIGKKDEQFIIVVNIEKILNSDELSFLSEAATIGKDIKEKQPATAEKNAEE